MEERRVVLIENDKGLRAVLRGTLTQAGWKVVGEASAGRRGVELTLDERPQVVLMDLQTARMTAHVRDIYRKLEVTSRAQAVSTAVRDKTL